MIADDFRAIFGTTPDVVVRSPGRVNLIGEHTDYNDGFALPAALDLGTDIAVHRRTDRLVRTVAARLGERFETTVDDLLAPATPGWARYVHGTIALVGETGGLDILIDGDLPLGAGLSSSASLTVGLALAVHAADGRTLARLGQRVENEIVGVSSGIMDQLAVALAVAGHALLLDCRSLDAEPVALPSCARLLVLDSGVARTLAGSAYNQRRAECAAAVAGIPGARSLRDVSVEQLDLLDGVELRRARHVVTENQRVLDCAVALRAGDLAHAGELMAASHASLRDDYEVSIAELDRLVDIAAATPGVHGARLTGAGFGGCAVALVDAEAASAAARRIIADYGGHGRSWVCTPAAGAHVQEIR